jgi:hypothetical protein
LNGAIVLSHFASEEHLMVISKLLAAVLLILLSAAARAEPILTMFGNAIPQTAVVADAKAVTLGVKFRTTHPGKVLGIRFFRGAWSRDGYAVKLFDSYGSLLAAAKAWKETCVVPCGNSSISLRLCLSSKYNLHHCCRVNKRIDSIG